MGYDCSKINILRNNDGKIGDYFSDNFEEVLTFNSKQDHQADEILSSHN